MIHLEWIAANQVRWKKMGFTWFAGNPATNGLRLLFRGDVRAAREFFGSDRLVDVIRSDRQGF
jgi:hypothetical protein